MKTKLLILIVSIVALTISSCSNDKTAKVDVQSNVVTADLSTSKVVETPFANPVFIYGSSFGNFFQTLYKQGKFDEMMKFTSTGSISKFGKENIRKMYESMDFAYNIKLHSSTGTDTVTLNYTAGIVATKQMVRIPVVVENDTAKIVLFSLKGLR